MNNTEKTLDYWIQRAQEIATKVHDGQTRRNGGAYIEHPARVAAKSNKELKPIAWLHDTIEDHPDKISLNDLKEEGFPDYIISAVDLLSHKDGDSNEVYWNKIAKNSSATIVKLLDIQDNLNSTPSDHAKKKYAIAIALFGQLGYSIPD